jgi:hypothetical protein
MRRAVAPRTIIRNPYVPAGSWPEDEQENELSRVIDKVKRQQQLNGRAHSPQWCELRHVARRGGNSYHDKYAASLGPGEFTLKLPMMMWTAEGYDGAGYDGIAGALTLFEAKTGHQEFPWDNKKAEGEREQQFGKQMAVARFCGFGFFVAVDNADGFNRLKAAFPEVPIEFIPFGGGPYF